MKELADIASIGITVLVAVLAYVEAGDGPSVKKGDLLISPPVPPPCGAGCAIFCPFGNVLDFRGCPTCTCKKEPSMKCGPICRMFCPNGFVKNINGCPICKCKPVKPPICGPVCMIACPFGNVLDKRGCPTCICKEPPVTTTKCPRGTKMVLPRTTCPPWRMNAANLGFRFCGEGAFCHVTNGILGICCRKRKITPIGKCPPLPKSTIQCKRIVNQCKSDKDCKRGRCCPGRCGRVCVPNKPSFPLPVPY